jgi:hypothetical protein
MERGAYCDPSRPEDAELVGDEETLSPPSIDSIAVNDSYLLSPSGRHRSFSSDDDGSHLHSNSERGQQFDASIPRETAPQKHGRGENPTGNSPNPTFRQKMKTAPVAMTAHELGTCAPSRTIGQTTYPYPREVVLSDLEIEPDHQPSPPRNPNDKWQWERMEQMLVEANAAAVSTRQDDHRINHSVVPVRIAQDLVVAPGAGRSSRTNMPALKGQVGHICRNSSTQVRRKSTGTVSSARQTDIAQTKEGSEAYQLVSSDQRDTGERQRKETGGEQEQEAWTEDGSEDELLFDFEG